MNFFWVSPVFSKCIAAGMSVLFFAEVQDSMKEIYEYKWREYAL